MEEFFNQIWTLVVTFANPKNLRHPERYVEALKASGVYWTAFVAVNMIIFTETGLLIGFLLPGDSLLVVTGVVANAANWPLLPLIGSLCVAAIVGDTVGYAIGSKTGEAIFNRPQSRFFKRDHLLAAKSYYEKHGGKTIVIARFIPLIRTFVPVVAGAAKMEYRSFLMFNICGGIGWIVSMIMIGYSLDPVLRSFLGDDFQIAKHIDKVVLLVVFLSILPLLTKAYKAYQGKRTAKSGPATADKGE
jgi:membrane-associated protein